MFFSRPLSEFGLNPYFLTDPLSEFGLGPLFLGDPRANSTLVCGFWRPMIEFGLGAWFLAATGRRSLAKTFVKLKNATGRYLFAFAEAKTPYGVLQGISAVVCHVFKSNPPPGAANERWARRSRIPMM